MKKVELLAPAGEMNALIAAVQNGADAVYVGGRLFGARANASNFDGEGLVRAVEYCHLRGVKLYMTVNTLVRDDELPAVYEMVRQAVEAGIDAAIVQDLGVAGLLRRCFPDLHLHASTQMTLASRRGAEFARSMGMTRVVPARECTLSEISEIASTGLEVEVFVHGALCVGYSGQCLLSSMIGGRSGNRGRCAQPCRLPYTMDGKKKHFLSPADLCMRENLGALIDAGTTSLKIEGRLKRPEYVAVVTNAYRRALDCALEGTTPPKEAREELLKIFNRGGFTRGYAMGENDAGIMATARPNHWGVPVGEVLSVQGGRARVKLSAELHAGDGLEARGKAGDHGILVQNPEAGALRVPEGVRPGDRLFRTTDAEQLRAAQESYAQEHRQTRVDARFTAHVGQPCTLTLGGCTVTGDVPQPARGKPLDAESVRRQVGKLGDTVLQLGALECELDDGLFLPASALNALRRDAAQACERAILNENTPSATVRPFAPLNVGRFSPERTLLVLQSDDPEELLAAVDLADELYFAPRDYTLEGLKSALSRLPEEVAVVLPTVLSDAELEQALQAIGTRRVVCNNLAQLRPGCVGDIGLNAFNRETVRRLLESGAVRVTASPECTLAQAQALAQTAPVEMIVYGNTPWMTLRHCPIRAERGLGAKGREQCSLCGHRGTVLTDRKGEPLRLVPYWAKSGCRLQVYSSRVYSALEEMPRIAGAGFAALRVIGTKEDLLRCRAAFKGGAVNAGKGQTTFGHLFKGVE